MVPHGKNYYGPSECRTVGDARRLGIAYLVYLVFSIVSSAYSLPFISVHDIYVRFFFLLVRSLASFLVVAGSISEKKKKKQNDHTDE